jgi:hypothetical protein
MNEYDRMCDRCYHAIYEHSKRAILDDNTTVCAKCYDELQENIEIMEEVKMSNTVTVEQIKNIMDNSQFLIHTILNKTTIVVCQLPNGFTIVESSSCVDPKNYDEVIGYEICKKRIENKLWELEGYCLQKELGRL